MSNFSIGSVGTTQSSNIDKGSYYNYFGNIEDGTVYQRVDPVSLKSEIDLRHGVLFNENNKGLSPSLLNYKARLKAAGTTTGGAGTAGYAMDPVFVDPRMVDRSRKYTPVSTMIQSVTNRGMNADFNVITAKGNAFTAKEDDSLSENNDTKDRSSTKIKFLYSVGRVTGPLYAAQPSYILNDVNGSYNPYGESISGVTAPNAVSFEVATKTRALAELEEALLVKGNATTSALSQNENGTEFNGITTIMSTTNAVDKSSTSMSLEDIQTAAGYAYDDSGRPTFGICDSSTYQDIINLITEKIRVNPQKTAEYGFNYIEIQTIVGPIKIIPSQFLTTTSGSKSLYLIDPTVWQKRVLQGTSYEELAKTNDSRKFMLKKYMTMVCMAPSFNASILNIA